ncbi:MAG TPA: Gfo/Idh/MocA family oxidoreductase [Ignavibacteria bacterium]|nr:Gfo/Idh/MocA family oxidoreductase [Ignavibacteria bacterium]
MYKDIKLAIVGCGKWGMNHVRTANLILGKNFKIVCDSFCTNKDKISEISSEIIYTENLDDIINDKEINAVIVSSPAETHYEITKKLLLAGKNVLVEKPITLVPEEAEELIQIAKKDNLKLMVGHVLLYHPAVMKIKELVDKGIIGKLQYIYSNRLNLGTIRSEENIWWSFAPHDISVIQFLNESDPDEISSNGADFIQNGIEDTTLTYLKYPGNVHAHIFVSWLHPFKEQRLVVIGDKGMLVFEDSLKSEKLKFYKKGFHKTEKGLEKFENEYEVVTFDEKKPLEEEQKHFFESIINNTTPLTDGVHALKVLNILEKAHNQLKN